MSKPSFPKNNPFKDALLPLKENMTTSRQKTSSVISENKHINKTVTVKVPANSSISQNEINELSESLKSITRQKKKIFKKELNRQFDSRPKKRVRDEAAINALRNPLDLLLKDTNTKPIVIRKVTSPEIKKSTPVRQIITTPEVKFEGLKIINFPNAENPFTWTKSSNQVRYRFDFSRGKQFQPKEVGDEDIDMVMGFDFGTSSSKVTIRDQNSRKSYAIKFGLSDNLGDYLIPSKIYLDGNNFNLNNKGKEFSNLKIRAISSNPSDMDLLAMVAYMALVIRHARSYFFRNYGENYRSQRFLWHLNVGIPARTAEKFDSRDRFVNVAKAALLCSYGVVDSISIEQAKSALRNIKPEVINLCFKQLDKQMQHSFGDSIETFNDHVVNVFPEIMAQIHGFVRSNLWNDQLNPHILLIDIGAGTVDISLCDVIRNRNSEYIYTSKACMVEGLGVSNLVKYRINKVLDASNGLDEESLNQVLNSLSMLEDINYGGIQVPSSCDQMLEGFKFEDNEAKKNLDKDFKNSIGTALWSKTVLVASQGSIPGDETWKPFPVFLCGGGSRMPFYKEIAELYTVGGRKARFDMKKIPQPNDFFGVEAGEDYDRLSVAYGLGYKDLGQFLPDFESPEFQTAGDDSPSWSDNFISKDII